MHKDNFTPTFKIQEQLNHLCGSLLPTDKGLKFQQFAFWKTVKRKQINIAKTYLILDHT